MLTKTATRIAEEYGYDFVLQQDLFMKNLLTKLVKNKEKIDRTNLANSRKQFKERSHTWYCTNCLYVYKSRYSIDSSSICKNCAKSGKIIKVYQYDLENLVYPLYRFGAEFEGVWTRNPHYSKTVDKIYYHLDQKSDGSVKGFGSVDNLYHIGEMTTEPIRFNTKGLEKFRYIIQKCYPQRTNKYCGGHIHVSFSNNKMVEPLLTRDFYDGIFDGLTNHVEKNCSRVGQNEYFDRIEDNSGYCKDVFDPENSIIRNSDRYFKMNLHPWHQRHTVEFRVLPQFKDSSDYYTCVMYMLNYTDNYLRDHLWIGENNQKTHYVVPDLSRKTRTVNYKLLKPIMKLEHEMLVEAVEEDLIESHTNIESWNRDVSLQEARLQRRNEALEQALERNQQRQQTLGDRLDESVELTSVEEDFSYLEELMQEDDQVNEEEDE